MKWSNFIAILNESISGAYVGSGISYSVGLSYLNHVPTFIYLAKSGTELRPSPKTINALLIIGALPWFRFLGHYSMSQAASQATAKSDGPISQQHSCLLRKVGANEICGESAVCGIDTALALLSNPLNL